MKQNLLTADDLVELTDTALEAFKNQLEKGAESPILHVRSSQADCIFILPESEHPREYFSTIAEKLVEEKIAATSVTLVSLAWMSNESAMTGKLPSKSDDRQEGAIAVTSCLEGKTLLRHVKVIRAGNCIDFLAQSEPTWQAAPLLVQFWICYLIAIEASLD